MKIFTKNSTGLYIADSSLKFVQLFEEKGALKLGRFGEIKIPEGILEEGMIKQPKLLKKIFADLQKKIKSKSLNVSYFPDQIFLADLLREAGFNDIYFESAGIALARLCLTPKAGTAVMIVSFGELKTDMYVAGKNETHFLTALDFGRQTFESVTNSDLLLPYLSEKVDEQFVSWHTHEDNKKKKRPHIRKIFLTGELPKLNTLSDYLTSKLKISVETIPVWDHLIDFQRYIPEMNAEESLEYSVPIGLAIRTLRS